MKPDEIIQIFPKLATDKVFRITSPVDHNYNCIAWAGLRNKIFWWPFPIKLDGTDWPFGLPRSEDLNTFILLFQKMEYVECESYEFEHHFMKIAIYQDPKTGKCTHASRQTSDGFWTSKLGSENDITHQDPYTVEGNDYGVVTKIMKRHNTSYDIKRIKKR